MMNLPSGTHIWLVAGVTDMHKSFNGLGELIQHALDDNPFSGLLFIFRGRRGNMVKILWADADGLCLFTKRMEEGQFLWLTARDGNVACRAAGAGLQRPEGDPHCQGEKGLHPMRLHNRSTSAITAHRSGYRRAGSAGPRVNGRILRTPAAISPVRNLCPSGRGAEPGSALQLGGCLLPVNAPAG
ncbi:Putative transposase [Klebsiella quasipneumoniae]|nr:Putative transposase [Klebsiella quasipneumoniae]